MTTPPSAERGRIDRVMSGVYAATLALEALTLLLVPRTAAQGGGLTGVTLSVTLGLAAAFAVLAGMQRRRWGFAAGSAAQVAFIATGFIEPAMFFLGGVFGVIWLYTIRVQHDLRARSDGPRPGAG
ncbi:MAG: DUF4233 domain-containing protein [Actinomycetota bacterium]|nr:DUF4233 domain-containing protein [Actinomycetota bacterium]